LQRVEDIIRAERRATVDAVATAIGCSRGQAYNMMHFLLSWRWCVWKSSVRVVPTATKRILRRRFPGTCETVGQVFKFVWRLCWKINVVCMSVSPFYSFQSRFVTYLLNRPRIKRVLWQHIVLCKGTSLRMRLIIGVHIVLRSERLASLSLRNTLRTLVPQWRTLTQHDMLPQYSINIRELINECF